MFGPVWRRVLSADGPVGDGKAICQHFVPSADGNVGRWDGPSVNILSRLRISATRRSIWRLLSTCDAATLGVLPGDYLSTCNDATLGVLPILRTSCSFCSFSAFCQVLSTSCKFLFLLWKMATLELFQQYCERFGGSKSKVINRQKGEQIVKALAEGHQYRHFGHFIKSKGFSRLTCEQVDLENVLCIRMSDKQKVL